MTITNTRPDQPLIGRRRRDRPGYLERKNVDGTISRYWLASRASKDAPTGIPSRRIPDIFSDSEVVDVCKRWTAELRDQIARAAEIEAVRPRRNVAMQLAAVYRKRAGDRGWVCSIDADWIEQRLADLQDCCEISGLAFDYSAPQKVKKYFKNPRRPSMDRIDNSRGYEASNLRVVLHCVNIGINEWGLDNYLEVCRAIAARA